MPEPFCKLEAPTPHAQAFVQAVNKHDAAAVKDLLAKHEDLRAQIDAPWFCFDSPAVVAAKDRATLDVLLDHGADINAPSSWWAGGFRAIDTDDAELARYLRDRGATVDAYAAARLGDTAHLTKLISADPACVNMKGGDGQRPLHVAADPATIDLLLDHGAEIDARDIDHEATPAQYQADKPDNARRLIERGATPDIFLACVLNDAQLLKRVLNAEPDAPASKVGACPHTKMCAKEAGGHIYQWKLKGAKTPLQVCARFGHTELGKTLYAKSPLAGQFIFSCEAADEAAVQKLLGAHPDLLKQLQPDDKRALCDAAWEGNLDAVRVMLDAGFDPHVSNPEKMTPLHCAAFHGEKAVAELLLARDPHPPLEEKNVYGGTVMTTMMHGAVHGWKKDTDYPGTAEALLKAGSVCKKEWLPCQHAALNAVLERHAT